MRRGKNYRQMAAKVVRTKQYDVTEGIELLKEARYAKFDETVELAVNLGLNTRHADQALRGAVVLPHGLGKTVRVVVFAKGAKEQEALAAGADYVGGEDLIKKIKDENWMEFDQAIATPDMMGLVGRIGKILGPRGLMPNPKVGTVTFDVTHAIQEMKAGRVEFRADKTGIVHVPVGKISFDTAKLRDNIVMMIDTLNRMKPASAKAVYMKNVTLSSTMGPGIHLDQASMRSDG